MDTLSAIFIIAIIVVGGFNLWLGSKPGKKWLKEL